MYLCGFFSHLTSENGMPLYFHNLDLPSPKRCFVPCLVEINPAILWEEDEYVIRSDISWVNIIQEIKIAITEKMSILQNILIYVILTISTSSVGRKKSTTLWGLDIMVILIDRQILIGSSFLYIFIYIYTGSFNAVSSIGHPTNRW